MICCWARKRAVKREQTNPTQETSEDNNQATAGEISRVSTATTSRASSCDQLSLDDTDDLATRSTLFSSNAVATWCVRLIESSVPYANIQYSYAMPAQQSQAQLIKHLYNALVYQLGRPSNKSTASNIHLNKAIATIHQLNDSKPTNVDVSSAVGQALLAYYQQDYNVLAEVPRSLREDMLFAGQYFTNERIARDHLQLLIERMPHNSRQELDFIVYHLARLVYISGWNNKAQLAQVLAQQWAPSIFRLKSYDEALSAAAILRVLIYCQDNRASEPKPQPVPVESPKTSTKFFSRNKASYRSLDSSTIKQRSNNPVSTKCERRKSHRENTRTVGIGRVRHHSVDSLTSRRRRPTDGFTVKSSRCLTTDPPPVPPRRDLMVKVPKWSSKHSVKTPSWQSVVLSTPRLASNAALASPSTPAASSWKTSILDPDCFNLAYPEPLHYINGSRPSKESDSLQFELESYNQPTLI